jgi:diguanylate cyclase (GGDEF)-like protein
MANWLLVSSIHSENINSTYVGRPWPYRVLPNERLRTGDLVYLLAGQSGLYGWGYITDIQRDRDPDQQEMMNLLVSRPVVQGGLGSPAEIDQHLELTGILDQLEGNFVELKPKQANALNSVIALHRAQSPPDVQEIQDQIGNFGVRNATSFQPKLELAIQKFNLASALFLDLDNFKAVNDRYDHDTGDLVIRRTLKLAQSVIGHDGDVFHRSGDEVMMLLPNVNQSKAKQIAEEIRSAIEQEPFAVVGRGVVTATIGGATYPDNCAHWEELSKVADQTAMRAKRIRKNLVLMSGEGSGT